MDVREKRPCLVCRQPTCSVNHRTRGRIWACRGPCLRLVLSKSNDPINMYSMSCWICGKTTDSQQIDERQPGVKLHACRTCFASWRLKRVPKKEGCGSVEES